MQSFKKNLIVEQFQGNYLKYVFIMYLLITIQTDFGVCILAGLPRASRAWERAPYSWNKVNLFSFGCHLIDRAYVRVYGLYGWGRGDY